MIKSGTKRIGKNVINEEAIQADIIIRAVLYGMIVMHLCKQSGRLNGVLDTKI